MKTYTHFEGKYIPYDEKIKQNLLHKMSNYTACGLLFDLRIKQFHTEMKGKVTCPDCLKEIEKQKRLDDIKYNKIYIRNE